MEALHHDAHLEQKENVEADVGNVQQSKLRFSGGANNKSLMTPKRPFRIHSDSKSTGKKGLKDSASKKRCVLLWDSLCVDLRVQIALVVQTRARRYFESASQSPYRRWSK